MSVTLKKASTAKSGVTGKGPVTGNKRVATNAGPPKVSKMSTTPGPGKPTSSSKTTSGVASKKKARMIAPDDEDDYEDNRDDLPTDKPDGTVSDASDETDIPEEEEEEDQELTCTIFGPLNMQRIVGTNNFYLRTNETLKFVAHVPQKIVLPYKITSSSPNIQLFAIQTCHPSSYGLSTNHISAKEGHHGNINIFVYPYRTCTIVSGKTFIQFSPLFFSKPINEPIKYKYRKKNE